MENVISVTKTVRQKFTANYVNIRICASGEAEKYSDAVAMAEENVAAVVSCLPFGINLSRGDISVNPVRAEKKTVGFRAAINYSAEFDLDGAILKAVTDALCSVAVEWNVGFSFKDRGERKQLMARAVKEARSDAQTIADAAEVKIGALVSVEYSSNDIARPMLMRASMYDENTPPEQITLEETVVCSWKIA